MGLSEATASRVHGAAQGLKQGTRSVPCVLGVSGRLQDGWGGMCADQGHSWLKPCIVVSEKGFVLTFTVTQMTHG